MATTDNNLQVINSMTEEMMNSLKDSNGKIPSLANQLVMTDDENSSHLQYTRLWDNPAPLSPFPAQTVTLDLTDYKFLIIELRSRGDWAAKSYNFTFVVPIDGITYTICYFDVDNGINKRDVVATSTGVYFSNSTAGAGGAEWSNKPITIYGVG